MDKEISTFGNIEIEKNKFYHDKTAIFLRYRYWKSISFGEKNCKYFIGYSHDNHKVKSLHIMLPKTTAYVKKWRTN